MQKISLFCLVAISVFGASAGGYGGAARRSPLSASAWARGGASTANPDLGYAFWNPARSGDIERLKLSFGGAVLPLGRGDGFAAVEGRIGRSRVGLSGAFMYRGINDLGEQYISDEVMIESGESYSTFSTKIGLGFAITKRFNIGLAMGLYRSTLPMGYSDGAIEYGKSSSVGGVTLMAAWKYDSGLMLAAGVRELFTTDTWDREVDKGGYAPTFNDTSLAPFVAAVSYTWPIGSQKLRVDSDLNVMIMDAYFQSIGSEFATWNTGVSWGLNDMLEFRIGVRDFLLTSTMFSDGDLYKIESTAKFTGGIGIDLGRNLEISGLKINYAISSSGVGAGIDQVFDFLFEF